MKEIVCITTYPPRECGIATFSDDLIQAILNKFGESYSIKICALESKLEQHEYEPIVKYTLNTSVSSEFATVAKKIEQNTAIELVCIQHEFGLFHEHEELLPIFIKNLGKPVIIVFHTVLPHPTEKQIRYLNELTDTCSDIVVMTQMSARILKEDYLINAGRIKIIPHGTHLVSQMDKRKLKEKYGYSGRQVLSTFGLLSPGKSIETTLDALPGIIKKNPAVLFLIIGKMHPTILKTNGETYRLMLEKKVNELGLEEHVRFINRYLELHVLLEYLQLTDVYLFTSNDPNQAVSGTFVYALSCGCPIIATPIPHALELLENEAGLIFNFRDSTQLTELTNQLLMNRKQQQQMKIVCLQKMAETAWENVAIAYASLFKEKIGFTETLNYSIPPINIEHIKRMSHNFAMVQFSRGNRPDITTGYTLDDNARALMALCQMYIETQDISCEKYIRTYLNFIIYCAQPNGKFLNYVNKDLIFTPQNQEVGLEDSNARAISALGYFILHNELFPGCPIAEIIQVFKSAISTLYQLQSPRSIAFAIKGLSWYYQRFPSTDIYSLICLLANKLVEHYIANTSENWLWFETYLTYENSVLSESLLYAYAITHNEVYKNTAKESFDFLLKKIFCGSQIKVISNKGWLHKGRENYNYGEQPIDVAGTVIALAKFHSIFLEKEYSVKQHEAFSWFQGNNHLRQIIYNPATGGCYDGLEETNINLNQGAESSVCYLLARLAMI